MASIVSSLGRYVFRLFNPPWFPGVSFLVESMHLTRAYYVAAELGIADLVQQRPRDAAELARATGTDHKSLHRILRALAAFRVFREDREGCFHMTRRARVLLSEGRQSLRSWLMLMGSKEVWQGFAQSLESVRTGISAFELAHGQGFYQYLSEHEKLGVTFAKAMGSWTEWHCQELVRAYDFSRANTVLDLGGGMGGFLAHLLKKYPRLRGILLDLPGTVEMAQRRFEAVGLADRCEFVGGSFLDGVPTGADVCVVKHVISDWDDDQAVNILGNCHSALGADGTLLLVGAVVDPRNNTDRIVKLVDLEMNALVGGRLRTRDQLNLLLARAGFRLTKVHPTLIPDGQIIEARKVMAMTLSTHRPRKEPQHELRAAG
jgi:SAM-dependent methyltransferase